MLKRITSLLLVLIFVISAVVPAYALGLEPELMQSWITPEEQMEINAELDALRGEGFAANYGIAKNQITTMLNGFAHTRAGTVMYPEFFGGVYLNSAGQTALLIVESMLDVAEQDSNIGALIHAGVDYRLVEFSYAELRELQSTVTNTVHGRIDWCDYALNVSLILVNPHYNRVVVVLVEYNDDMIAGFRQHVYDSPMIIFEQGNRLYIGGPPNDAPFRHYNDCEYMYSVGCMYFDMEIEEASSNPPLVVPGQGLYRNFSLLPLPHGSSGFMAVCRTTRNLGYDFRPCTQDHY